MAKISTYPILSTPTVNDLLIGTDVENLNETKNFSIGDIGTLINQDYVPYVGATGNVNLGSFNITGGGFIVGGGTASQFLKADGSLDSTLYTPQTRTLTINGTTYNLSANRSWDLNTIDSLTTTGTSGAATYVGKVLNIPVYQAQGSYITQISGEATGSGPGNATVTLDNTAVISKILTGLNVTGGTVVSTDTILQAFGKVQNQINGLAGGVEYQGVWNAATNTPFLQSSVGTQGHYYVVDVAGNTNLNGITDWQLGDWAIYNGSVWQKVDNTDAVVSVNGYVGAVVLTASDVGAVPTTRTLTINGVGYNLSADRAWTVGDVRTDGSYANPSWITSLGWSKITGTPTTLAGYGITDGALNTTTLTINGTTYDLTANRTWNVGTVTSVGTSGPLTGGTITGSGTIGITQSSSTTDGYLSASDWNAFNSKQGAISVNAPLTFVSGVIGITQSGASTDGYLSSTDWNTFNSKVSGSGTANTLPMWGSASSLINSPLSYAADAFNFQYNSSTGGTVNFTNIGLTTYTYSIQMNNFGSPRSTIHSYTDGLIIQSIGGTQVSRMFANGNLILGNGTVDNGYKLEVTGDLYVNTIANAATDTDRFIVSDGGLIKYRTGAQVLSDIGAQGALTLTTTGSSGPATLIGDTLNIPNYSSSLTGYVPYTGATQNVNLGEYGLTGGYFLLDTTPTGTPTSQGTIYWDDSKSTAALIMNGTIQHIGQDTYFYVKNSTGSSIPKGTAVRFAGTDGASGHLLIAPFLADGTYPSSYFMGVTSETIANGAFGQVSNFGELSGINTSAYTAGDLLYASTTVAGGFQTTPPVAPNNIVLVAAAINSKNNGDIVVRPLIGSNINNDEGIKITSPTTGDLLQLQAGGLWENKTIDGAGIVTKATTQTITGAKTFNSLSLILAANGTSNQTIFSNSSASQTSMAGINFFGFNQFNDIYFNKGTSLNAGFFQFNNTAARTYTLPDATGTIALVGGAGVGTVTSVAALTLGTSGTDLSSTVANSTTTPVITLNVPTASATNRGALSAADWTTFNNKQNALTNPVTGTGAAGQVAFWDGTNSITSDGGLTWDDASNRLTIGLLSTNVPLVVSSGNVNETVALFTGNNVGRGLTIITYNSGADDSGVDINAQHSSGQISLSTAGNQRVIISNNSVNFRHTTLAANSISFDTSYQDAFTINSLGRILINSTSDNGARLQVSGTSTISGIGYFGGATSLVTSAGVLTSSSILQIFNGGGAGSNIDKISDVILANNSSYTDGSIGRLIGVNTAITTSDKRIAQIAFVNNGAINSGQISFATLNAGTFSTKMTLTSTGNVGIGTTAPAFAVGSGLEIERDSATATLRLQRTGTNTSNLEIRAGESVAEFVVTSGSTPLLFSTGGSERMRITSDGNVGIGTNSPTVRLDVSTTSGENYIRVNSEANQDSGYRIAEGGTNKWLLYNVAASDAFAIYDNTALAERLRITSTGNVGIGTSSPDSYTGTASTRVLAVGTTSGNNGVNVISGTTSTGSYMFSDSGGNDRGGLIYFHTSDLMTLTTAGSERMRITSSGNVGIGTTSPASALTIVGATNFENILLRSNDTANSAQRVGIIGRNFANTATFGIIGASDLTGASLDVFVGLDATIGANTIQFRTAPTYGATSSERMRITSDGKLLIGTTDGTSTDKVRINNDGTTSYSTVRISNANSTGNLYMGVAGSNVGNATLRNNAYIINAAASSLLLGTSDTTRLAITSSGNVGIGTSSPNRLLTLAGTSNAYMSFNASSNRNTTIGSDGFGNFIVFDDTASAYRMVINSSGSVLIGTTTDSGYKLDVNGTGRFTSALYVSNTNGTGVVNAYSGTSVGTYIAKSQSATANFVTTGVSYPRGLGYGAIVGAGNTTDIPVNNSAWNGGFGGNIGFWSDIHYGVEGGTNSVGYNAVIRGSGDSSSFGFFADLSGAVGGNRYGIYTKGEAKNYFSGNVGIGTTSPATALHVSGAAGNQIRYSSPNVSNILGVNSSDVGVIGTVTNHDLAVYTNATERMRITSGGNVLIGTTTDNGLKLQVSGDIFIPSGYALFGDAGPIARFDIGSYNYSFAGSSFVINPVSATATFSLFGKTQMTIEGLNDRVGIGTTSPRSTADVNGVLTVGDANPPAINLYRNVSLGNNASAGTLNFGGRYDATNYATGANIITTTVGIWSATNYGTNLQFNTTAQNSTTLTERMRITSDGFLRMASGSGGIQFNGDTAAANALDDYEEGTWTPVIRGSGTLGTYQIATSIANYTKIGRQVTATAYIVLAPTVTGGGTGYAQITGLPFEKGNNMFTLGSARTSGITYTGDYLNVEFISTGGTSIVYLVYTVNGGSADALPVSSIGANDVIGFTITYFV